MRIPAGHQDHLHVPNDVDEPVCVPWSPPTGEPMANNVNDFVSVEDGNIVVWTADGHMQTVAICTRATQAELGAEAIKNALCTYEGWSRE